jgi:general secretion pathway protein F
VLALHELATLLNSGVPLLEAMEAQANGGHHPDLQSAFNRIASELRAGTGFAESLGKTGLPLPDYVITLARAGEAAGLIGRALQDAVAQMEYELQIRADVRNALTYPFILVMAGLTAVAVMFTFVVPRFANLLDRADELPLLAWAVLNGGLLARELAPWLLVIAALSAWAVRRWWWNAERRNRLLDGIEKLPVLGEWRVEAETARWAKILATLLGNRVALMDALELSRAGVDAPSRRARLGDVARAVRGGRRLADALEEQSVLSPTGYNLVRVGERTGELPAMLQSLARLCENAGRARMKQFLALLEPAAIILIGGFIGLIMIGIILAITSANDLAV